MNEVLTPRQCQVVKRYFVLGRTEVKRPCAVVEHLKPHVEIDAAIDRNVEGRGHGVHQFR